MTRTEKNCPVVVTGENCSDYSFISNYMNMKSKVVKVDKKLAEQATGERSQRRQGRGEGAVIGKEEGGDNNGEDAVMGRENVQEQEDGNGDAAEGDVEVAVRFSNYVYTGIGVAIAFLYRQCGIEIPAKSKDSISQYCKGSKRRGETLKQQLALKITEGRRPMSFEVYKFIAKGLFYLSKKEHVFLHLFLILYWNVIKRSKNCVNMKVAHIRFHQYALVFEFAKSKGMQGGEDHVGPWHVRESVESVYFPSSCTRSILSDVS